MSEVACGSLLATSSYTDLTSSTGNMTEQSSDDQDKANDEFLNAAQDSERGLVSEFIMFMAENKMWWLTPILVVFGLLGVLLVLGATGVAPFIYTLF